MLLIMLKRGSPLIEEGVRGTVEVDVDGEPPLVSSQHASQLEDDEPSLDGGFPRVIDGLTPRRPVQLQRQHH